MDTHNNQSLTSFQMQIDSWNSLKFQGRALISELMNLVLKRSYISSTNWGILSNISLLQEKVSEKVEQFITTKLDELLDLQTQMVECVGQMSESLDAAISSQNQAETSQADDNLIELMAKLLEMYTKQLLLNKSICISIPKTKSHEQLTIYASSWINEPYVNAEFRTKLGMYCQQTT
mmetsp:Transcript_39/g.43  ORF Transcript_39/g.43 Transcript_39/m.43 type:complete len:177 (-) Transcript_39:76-606(-)